MAEPFKCVMTHYLNLNNYICGVDAISGGIFADSPALIESFWKKYKVDL